MTPRVPIDEEFFPPFEGFPRAALAFLRKLKRNNNRPWFQKHKTEYEELVRFPMQCLIATIGQKMQEEAPDIDFHPRKSIFRIYRDTRFSRNKTPYKTNVAASFTFRGAKGPIETPGLYVGIEPGEIFIGGGLYMPTGPQLKVIRRTIATEPERFLEIVRHPRFLRVFKHIEGERLQRAPLGYVPEHPMIEYLKSKQFYVGVVLPDGACHQTRFADTVVRTFTDCLPLVRWLSAAIS